MPYGHLIAAAVMTLGVCQGYSLTASFFSILTSASRGPSAIAELLAPLSPCLSLVRLQHEDQVHGNELDPF